MIDSSKPFPILESERLILKELTVADKGFLFSLRSDKNIMHYIPRQLPKEIDDVIPLIESTQDLFQKEEAMNWIFFIRETNEPIGSIGFYRTQKEISRTEVGYMSSPKHHRKGYTFEALQTVLKYAFGKLNFNSIAAVIDPRNEASRNMLVKSKFRLEGNFKEDYFFDGVFYDSEYYGMLKSEYEKIK
jgi:ribosomal-protein-alanine N-acetyltransferase